MAEWNDVHVSVQLIALQFGFRCSSAVSSVASRMDQGMAEKEEASRPGCGGPMDGLLCVTIVCEALCARRVSRVSK